MERSPLLLVDENWMSDVSLLKQEFLFCSLFSHLHSQKAGRDVLASLPITRLYLDE